MYKLHTPARLGRTNSKGIGTHGGEGGTFSQKLSSLALTVWKRQCFETWEEKDQLMNQVMNDKGNCRTAPATPGLLNTTHSKEEKFFP